MKNNFALISFLFFVYTTLTQLNLSLRDTWSRTSADDHYSWMLKAPQMQKCFKGDCRMLMDLKDQFSVHQGEFSFELNYKRWREEHCLFDVYTPLYTLQMIIFKDLFHSNWETAWELVTYLGYGIAVTGCFAFLILFFGPLATGLSFLILATNSWGFMRFAGISPSFITTGFFFWALAFYKKRPASFFYTLPLMILFMSLYHPIGKIYSVLFLVLLTVSNFERILTFRKDRVFFILAVLSLIAVMSLGFFSSPQFKLAKLPFDTEGDILRHFNANINALISTFVAVLFGDYSSPWYNLNLNIAVFVTALILFKKSNQGDYRVPFIGMSLLILNIATIFHFFNNHPGELTTRLIIPLYVFVTGLVCHLFFSLFLKKKSLLAVALTIAVCWMGFRVQFLNSSSYFKYAEIVTPNANVTSLKSSTDPLYSAEQVKKIFDKNGKCGTIVYFEQTPLWFYSLHGALDCGALATYVWPTPYQEINNRIETNRLDLSYAVIPNPVYNKIGLPALHGGRTYLFTFQSDFSEKFKIRYRTVSKPVTVQITRITGSQKISDTYTLLPQQSQELEFRAARSESIQLTTLNGEALLDSASFGKHNWPWLLPVELKVYDRISGNDQPVEKNVSFSDWTNLIKYYLPNNLEIADDNGGLTLVKIL